jgi:putative membrane protein
MRLSHVLTMAFTGASFCFLCSMPVLAQNPGGMPGGNPPMQQPGMPGANNPNNPYGTGNPGAIPGTQGPNQSSATPPKMDDQKFVNEAATGGLLEIKVGQLAQEKGQTQAVKEYGQKLVEDHTKADSELKRAAAEDGLKVPDTLEPKQQALLDKLSSLSGDQFDKAFVKDAVKDHEKDIKEFKREAEGGTHANIKQFASSTVPVLEQHLAMAKSLKKSHDNSLSASAAHR